MTKKFALFSLVVGLMLLLVGCAQPPQVEEGVVELTNFKFTPKTISVTKGDVIQFVNKGGSHTVTIDELGVDKVLAAGESVTVTVDREGTFALRCRFHENTGMTGIISTGEVQPTQPEPQPSRVGGYGYY